MLSQNLQELSLACDTILREVFGYHGFREGQRDIINATLSKRDALVVMPTGGGKSLCYQLPALVLDGMTLVISPLISLMKDQVDQLKATGVTAGYITSAQTKSEQQQCWMACRAGEIKLLYLSPERMMTDDTLWQLTHCKVNLIAIDEAHCISQWGHDFRQDYRDLGLLKHQFHGIPIIALTATADQATRQDITRLLNLEDPLIHISSFDRPNIHYSVLEKLKPLEQLLIILNTQNTGSGIIYCNSRNRVMELTERILSRGYRVAGYHAGLSMKERETVQEAFQRDDIQIVVATVAFGMGINKSNVRFVVHYDLPRSIEGYYQETGRAGRDGLPAQAWLFYDIADFVWLRSCIKDKPESTQLKVELSKLTEMNAYAQAQTCRRLVLLNYFGQHNQEPCQNCDICQDPPMRYDGLVDAQKVLSCIYKTGQRYGMYYIIDVLRGSQSAKIKQYGHQRISVYGLGKDRSIDYWVLVVRQLIHLGIIEQDALNHNCLFLTEAARPILRGEVPLQLAAPRKTTLVKTTTKSTINDFDPVLFSQLRELRKQIADEENVPPYIVFNDATLTEMAEKMPISEREMLAINGVGQKKLERFGKLFMAQIGEFLFEKE